MTIRIEPYRMWSGGARALGEALGVLKATRRQVEKHGDFDYIINWGNSNRRFRGEYVNKPEAVAVASNKLEAAKVFGNFGVPHPDWTSSMEVSGMWLAAGSGVVCRKLLRANSGRGIVLATPDNGVRIVRAPLYTKYIPKTTEYRVHILADRVIDAQEKRRRDDIPNEGVNWQIRNTDNGFIFARSDLSLPDCVRNAAVRAVSALALDFGAVDVGYNARRDKCRVYEVNTAPGLEGSTLTAYYNAFKEVFPQLERGAYKRRREG